MLLICRNGSFQTSPLADVAMGVPYQTTIIITGLAVCDLVFNPYLYDFPNTICKYYTLTFLPATYSSYKLTSAYGTGSRDGNKWTVFTMQASEQWSIPRIPFGIGGVQFVHQAGTKQ